MRDRLSSLEVKIFARCSDKESIVNLAKGPLVQGFLTTPPLMRKAGVKQYEPYCRELLAAAPHRPFAFDVLSDDIEEMERQALRIAAWSPNAYVTLPIANTRGQNSATLVHRLSKQGVRVNVTAVMTVDQVESLIPALKNGPPSYVSMLAGRIADAGCDPVPTICAALTRLRNHPNIELIWSSTRELFNIIQADQIGCPIISVGSGLLKKLPRIGRDLIDLSLETVTACQAATRESGLTLA